MEESANFFRPWTSEASSDGTLANGSTSCTKGTREDESTLSLPSSGDDEKAEEFICAAPFACTEAMLSAPNDFASVNSTGYSEKASLPPPGASFDLANFAEFAAAGANFDHSAISDAFFCGLPIVGHLRGVPPGVPSVQEAVEMIHRQEAAAKQMKKLRPKKFRCDYCDVAFSNNGQLKGHIRIHTGERPFKCDVEKCGKSFTRNEELTRHKRIHTGLRPHACVLCGKRFGRKDHLKKHTRTHDNRDPYRLSATAFGVFALRHTLPPSHPFPPYFYTV